MKRIFFLLPVLFLLCFCKGKKTSLTDDDTVEASEFIEFFPEVKLPFTIADTSLTKKHTDSQLIGPKIFAQFIPDSFLVKDFGKTVKPKLYPLGRAVEKGKETYLFIKATHGNKRVGYLACFNRDDEFLNMMPIIRTGYDNFTQAYGLVDKKYQITTYRARKKNADELTFKRNVYIYNDAANAFMLILTEPNEEIIEQVINPIDTLSKKKKYSGDYVLNSRNILSIRDAKNTNEILFFVHFEKPGGECNGELKGTARIIAPNIAQFKENGNPCTLEFTFGATTVKMKELEGCGSYRDIKCFFEGTFPKKREPKPKPAKKKK